MISVDFMFLIEHDDRETAATLTAVSHLERLGFSSVILSIEFHSHRFDSYFPKCVVFPYAISDQTWPVRNFVSNRWRNVSFVSLNWEQLLGEANKKFKMPKSEVVKKRFSHLAWDSTFQDFLVSSGVDKERIKVIGNPLHELLAKELLSPTDEVGRLACEFRLKQFKRVNFYPMNYGWAFLSDRHVSKKIYMGYSDSIAWDYRDYSMRCLDSFLAYIISAAKHFQNELFIVRPHPSVSEKQYFERLHRLGFSLPDNIEITKKYSVKEWVSVADEIGSSWSTVVWDSISVGKNGYLFTPSPRPRWMNTWWNDKVANIAGLSDYISWREQVEKSTKVVEESNTLERIAYWLIESLELNGGYGYEQKSLKGKLESFMYKFRSRLRELSMAYCRGVFVKSGIKRDYFVVRLFKG